MLGEGGIYGMQSKPQRLCCHDSCQSVALTGKRFCKHHVALRGGARLTRANAVRHKRWLPQNRSIIGIIDPRARSASEIAASAESILRAFEKQLIDRRRASVFHYALQISYSVARLSSPKDPELKAAGRKLYDLAMTLTGRKGGFTENR
jgi:hypothetical protein